MSNINISSDMDEFVRELAGLDNTKPGIFDNMADVMVFAASFGYLKGNSRNINTSTNNPIKEEIFKNQGHDTTIKLLAISEDKDPMVLENIPAMNSKRIEIFENYAYGGLMLMKEEMEGSPDQIESILRIICDEQGEGIEGDEPQSIAESLTKQIQEIDI